MLKFETKLNRIWLGFLVISLTVPMGMMVQPARQLAVRPASHSFVAISVVNELPEVREIAVTKTAAATPCSGVSLPPAEENLVQKAAPINLNFPANCFAMKLGETAPTAGLAVLPLAHQPAAVAVVVSLPGAQIVSVAVLPVGQGPISAAPGLFAVSSALPHKSVVLSLAATTRLAEPLNYIEIISIYRLNIMRC